MLKLLIKSASNLIDVDIGPNNKSDPYVKATFRGEEKKTAYIKDDLNPVWSSEHNNELEWDLGSDPILYNDEIHIKVKDYEKFLPKKLLGQVTIPLKDLLRTKGYVIDQTCTLVDSYNQQLVSTLSLKLQYKPSKAILSYLADEPDSLPNHADDDGKPDAEDEQGKITRKKRREKSQGGSLKREWSTKKRYFKITVKIHEGRQIPGINISPVARVTIKNKKQETRVKKSTNCPDFNQTFTFSFQSSEAELFDELIVFEVLNSKKVLRDALIGFFESDIGSIYEYPEHSIVRKWILLTGVGLQEDDDDGDKLIVSKWLRRRGRDHGGNAGYLKVTITVIGAGDDPPSMHQLEALVEDEEDVETNCLVPDGVTREPAEFHLKVYMAEDLPQMDAGFTTTLRRLFAPASGNKQDAHEKKKHVDPFFVLSFCGKKAETKTLYRQNNPSFNQLLKLPILYPTMCERIKFQFYDKDHGSKNDVISTSFLSLSHISGNNFSSSFLPHFGPCFVSFYGSPREYSIFRSDHCDRMNRGIGEGVAYRGRALVELTQEKSSAPSDGRPSCSNLHDEDIVRVQPYLRQEKYKLFACFKNAAMIHRDEKPIEFEVSIGNFGNKLDETEVSCYTPPTNPVYDGNHYHYLPWHRYKPCICLNCHWEDISFRIDPLNIINRLYGQLEPIIANAKLELESMDEEKKFASVRMALQQLIQKCSYIKKYIKVPKSVPPINTLDVRLAELRLDEIECIINEAMETVQNLLTQQAVDLENVMDNMKDYLTRLKSIAFEPQISIPDVIIWMLYGGCRVAYHRIPIQDVMYSPNKEARGKYCGKTMELLMKYPGEVKTNKEYQEVPAMVRVELWVGLHGYQEEWIAREAQEGIFKIYAETYENEMKTPLIGWSKPNFTMRPHFSNASGDVPLNMKNFVLSRGWEFCGEERAVMDKSLMYEQDWALSTYMEEIYEHQSRNLLGGEWSKESQWTEMDGHPSKSTIYFQIRPGWRWTDIWKVDENRAVDAEGWEYCVSEGLGGVYVKAAKPIHMTRRRRWIRPREIENSQSKGKTTKFTKAKTEEDWEYAATFSSKFHLEPRTRDLVRRRRLLKEIVPQSGRSIADLGLPPKLAINMNVKKGAKKNSKHKDASKKGQHHEDAEEVELKGCIAVMPRMFIVYQKSSKFQLWVSIYQGRDLLAMDDTGQSDPYIRVAFGNQTQKTEWKEQTLTPKWDQTLIFSRVELFETMENIVHSPPKVVMEVFDKDPYGKDDFIGRCMMECVIQTKGISSVPPTLRWISLSNGQANAGQVLVVAELFLDEGKQLPALPKPRASVKSSLIYPVRDMVRPELQTVAVEILCWGVRNMKNYNFHRVDRPSVQFEWGDRVISSEILQSAKRNPNFSKPTLKREIVKLEKEPFTPSMEIRVYDNRSFNQTPLVGTVNVSSIEMSCQEPLDCDEEPVSPLSPFTLPTSPTLRTIEEFKKEKEEFDWWSKYYYSMDAKRSTKQIKKDFKILRIFSTEDDSTKDHLQIYRERKYDTLEIYDRELEKVETFEGLNDFVTTLKLKRGKWKNDEEDEEDVVGELKANIRVYPVDEESQNNLPPEIFSNLKETKMTWPIKCVVRVYVICAFELQAHDASTGLADPYLSVSLGGKTLTSKERVQYNTLDPVFGEMFEFKPSIPLAKDLKIKVIDYDRSFDDDIGETTIDLEQRLLSRLHASCGLPKLYYVGGPYAWRDCKRPKDILKDYCQAIGYQMSFYPKGFVPNILVLGAKNNPMQKQYEYIIRIEEIDNYDDQRPYLGSRDQQLSLHALHRLGLVPEHVETRSLYSSFLPGIEQGKLQLWVDIFPKIGNVDIKPPVEIKPRSPAPYVLRVVIWDTTEVDLQETSITGERMSDIYVKGWIDGMDEKQKTDVHYRSLDGDGNFNWRMSFPMLILPIENQLVICKKENILHAHKTTQKTDPKLKIQIWENDKFSPDDFLGTRTLLLNDLPRPCKSPGRCGTKDDPCVRKERPTDYVDLFHGGTKCVRGWYACWKDEANTAAKPGGKVDLQIELLTEAQANDNPAGLGREDPNQHPFLPEPNRPATSFLWITSPLKSVRYIIWRNYKWYIIGLIISIFLVLLIVLFVYNVPGYSVKKLFGV